MGAGKTSVGRRLAALVGLPFVDLDAEVERREGASIPRLFEQGEAHFRAAERRALDAVLAGPAVILACGGGTPCQPGALEAIRTWGDSVYLEVSLPELRRRIGARDAGRPLWGEGVAQRLAERVPYYRQATLSVDAERPLQAVALAIASALAQPTSGASERA
jgi:shikimate kinase/3-dehydroquinate synthase